MLLEGGLVYVQGLFTRLLVRVRYEHAGLASGCCARSSWHGCSYRHAQMLCP